MKNINYELDNTKDNLRTMIKSFEELNHEANEMNEKVNSLEIENFDINNKYNSETVKSKNLQKLIDEIKQNITTLESKYNQLTEDIEIKNNEIKN